MLVLSKAERERSMTRLTFLARPERASTHMRALAQIRRALTGTPSRVPQGTG